MTDRRASRRSSPDAPQGVVPVLAVFVGLVVVAVVAAVNVLGSGEHTPGAVAEKAEHTNESIAQEGPTSVAPGTLLIRGTTTTTLFVTTTTPITTTTSTTTTTLPGPVLATSGAEVVFEAGRTSVTFTIRSADPEGVEFEITDLPPGMRATPMSGTVAEGSPVTVTLRITDPDKARSGSITISGADGVTTKVRVRIVDGKVSISSVHFVPSPPVCDASSSLVVEVRGSGSVSATATIDIGDESSVVALVRLGEQTWVGVVPPVAAGGTLSGEVTVKGADGKTVSEEFSTTVASGDDCSDD